MKVPIKDTGYPATFITAITNSDDLASVDLIGVGYVEVGNALFKICK